MVKMALFNKSTECFLTIKIQNIYTTSRTGFCSMKRNAKTIVAGIVALAMSHAAMAKDIKVAVVGAMSGPMAQWGDMEFNGARQAIKDINASGGIKGDKLVAVEYDDACDPKQAVAVANKIVNDGIQYVIGHLCSSSTQPASDIYEDEGILMISPGATNPELTQRGYQYIMRTAGLDSSQGPTAAKYIVEKVKPQRIAIIHDKQQYGEGLARSVQDNLKKAGPTSSSSMASPRGKRFLRPAGAPEEREHRLRLLRRLLPGNGPDAAPGALRRVENRVYGAGRGRQRLAVQYRGRRGGRHAGDNAKTLRSGPCKQRHRQRAESGEERSERTVRLDHLCRRSDRWRRRWTEPAASSRWI